jgi:hypothetical protein
VNIKLHMLVASWSMTIAYNSLNIYIMALRVP